MWNSAQALFLVPVSVLQAQFLDLAGDGVSADAEFLPRLESAAARVLKGGGGLLRAALLHAAWNSATRSQVRVQPADPCQ